MITFPTCVRSPRFLPAIIELGGKLLPPQDRNMPRGWGRNIWQNDPSRRCADFGRKRDNPLRLLFTQSRLSNDHRRRGNGPVRFTGGKGCPCPDPGRFQNHPGCRANDRGRTCSDRGSLANYLRIIVEKWPVFAKNRQNWSICPRPEQNLFISHPYS